MNQVEPEAIDVAIVGGGPAGLQAALVLARTRKHVVVFDDPTPPRNAASHGVHNFVGLDGMTPQQIRDQTWDQIDVYESARLVRERVLAVTRAGGSDDLIVATESGSWCARHVVLTCGYHDVFPDIDGFTQCWADTIIPCPFCDGFENRDRRWGIVPSMAHEPAASRSTRCSKPTSTDCGLREMCRDGWAPSNQPTPAAWPPR